MLIERNNDRYVLYFLFIKNCSEMKPNVKEYRLHNFIYRSIKAVTFVYAVRSQESD